MRYYVLADTHGFYTEMVAALKEKGYFDDTEPHKLLVCGDLFDRGREAVALQEFMVGEQAKGQLILIRGNHEDLTEELVQNATKWLTDDSSIFFTHHWSNGTIDTILQLTGQSLAEACLYPERTARKMENTPYFKKLLPAMLDYYETPNYIFTHGWIPCQKILVNRYSARYLPIPNWREQPKEEFALSRWYNGMAAAQDGVVEEGKTIVCGHWHCSYGHAKIEGKGTEFEDDADFTPYYGKGIIAIDACTAHSQRVNCIVIED